MASKRKSVFGRKRIFKNRKYYSMAIEQEIYERLREIAKSRGVSAASLVRKAVSDYLENVIEVKVTEVF